MTAWRERERESEREMSRGSRREEISAVYDCWESPQRWLMAVYGKRHFFFFLFSVEERPYFNFSSSALFDGGSSVKK